MAVALESKNPTPLGVGVCQYQDNEDNIYYENKKNNMKKVIRLTESDLHRIVENSVKKMIKEIGDTKDWQYRIGAVAGRAQRRRNNAQNDAEYYKQQNVMQQAQNRYRDLSTDGSKDMSYGLGRQYGMQQK